MSLVRNRILRFELGLGVAEICLGMAAAVTGFFGMNLLSGWEEVRKAANEQIERAGMALNLRPVERRSEGASD